MAGTAPGGKDLENASATLQNSTKDLRDTRAPSMVFVELTLLECVVRSWPPEWKGRGDQDTSL